MHTILLVYWTFLASFRHEGALQDKDREVEPEVVTANLDGPSLGAIATHIWSWLVL